MPPKQLIKQTQHGATPQTNSLSNGFPLLQLSMLNKGKIAPAPLVAMHVASDRGEAHTDVLPDSGADICAASHQFVAALGEHMDNLAQSKITPQAVNGTILQPLGMVPDVKFTL